MILYAVSLTVICYRNIYYSHVNHKKLMTWIIVFKPFVLKTRISKFPWLKVSQQPVGAGV